MKKTFDLDEALEAIKSGASIDGKDGVLTPLIMTAGNPHLQNNSQKLHWKQNLKPILAMK